MPFDKSTNLSAFPTKEPETYQAEIVITAGGIERKMRVARKGSAARIDYDRGTTFQKTFVRNAEAYAISEPLKLYAIIPPGGGLSDLQNDLTENLLNRKLYSTFESLGKENGLNKFRARIDESGLTEVLIFVSEDLGLPVRQEFYSVSTDGTRTLRHTYELRDAAFEVDDALFSIPTGFQRISMRDFSKRTSGN